MLQEQIGEQAQARPGRQYVLDADYFRRIDAMHYVLAHDDGQAQAGIAEADVVLVGVSRSSKTPTSFYLANRGVKAANVPLVPGTPDPPGLDAPRCPVIGLTLDPLALIEIRRHRLQLIAPARHRPRAPRQREYVDLEAVKAELLWARRLCTRRGWPVIDVTRRSIEETAATVLQLMEAWHERRRRSRDRRRGDPGRRARLILASGRPPGARCCRRPGWRSTARPVALDEAAVKALRGPRGGRRRLRAAPGRR